MTTTTAIALPTHGDQSQWNDQEKALVEAAGLTRIQKRGREETKVLADRPTVEAFLAHCRRTGLDPIARQIYAIYRGGKWGIQVSIDGARLVAERTGKYRGQTPVQWTDGTIVQVPLREEGKIVRDGSGNPIMVDDYRWLDTWLSPDFPKAARVGILHADFAEPLWAVANWDSYVVMKDVWVGGQKTDEQVVSDMWKKFGPLMLGKCAEMLGLRKAFPQDLSGLYSTEEMAQADGGAAASAPSSPSAPPAPPVVTESDRDWKAEIDSVADLEALTALANEAQRVGEWAVLIDSPVDGETETVGAALHRRRSDLQKSPETAAEPLPDSEPGKEQPRQWLREARGKATSDEIEALWKEASAIFGDKPTPDQVGILDELSALAARAPRGKTEPSGEWAPAEGEQTDGWSQPAGDVVDATVEDDEQ